MKNFYTVLAPTAAVALMTLSGTSIAAAQSQPWHDQYTQPTHTDRYDNDNDWRHDHDRGDRQITVMGRAFNVHGNSFTLYMNGHTYLVQSWSHAYIRSGDYVRVSGYWRHGMIYATWVRDLSH